MRRKWSPRAMKTVTDFKMFKSDFLKFPIHLPKFQGSTLGPLLFLLYINNINNPSEKLSFRLFADDTNIFFSSSDPKELERTVNAELMKVKNWCNVNKLSVNFTKINFMIVKSVRKRLNIPIDIVCTTR